jgi:hypothetical protein
MSDIRSVILKATVAAVCLLIALSAPAAAQNAAPGSASELGTETSNWGLAPFLPIPTVNLSEADKKLVRDIEDRQLQERRALEDKYEADRRALLIRQAEEREALKQSLSVP